ncbi:MAG: OsmC family protein [Vicinamibacterales bacterium]
MATKRAVVEQLQGISFAGKTESNHWIMMDGPAEFGGSDAGVRPKELVLLALAGCTGSDVVTILRKKRVPIDGFRVEITAEQAEEHPLVYKSIHLDFVLQGEDIKAADVERAIELSETKYCSVSAMLRPAVRITHAYRIESSAAVR